VDIKLDVSVNLTVKKTGVRNFLESNIGRPSRSQFTKL